MVRRGTASHCCQRGHEGEPRKVGWLDLGGCAHTRLAAGIRDDGNECGAQAAGNGSATPGWGFVMDPSLRLLHVCQGISSNSLPLPHPPAFYQPNPPERVLNPYDMAFTASYVPLSHLPSSCARRSEVRRTIGAARRRASHQALTIRVETSARSSSPSSFHLWESSSSEVRPHGPRLGSLTDP